MKNPMNWSAGPGWALPEEAFSSIIDGQALGGRALNPCGFPESEYAAGGKGLDALNAELLGQQVEVCVPANRPMLLVVRLATSGVVTRAGLSMDAVDDTKMAVEEACNCLMLQRSPFTMLKLCYAFEDEALAIAVKGLREPSDVRPTSGPSAADEEVQVIRCILESMVDGVELTRDDEGIRQITLVKRIAP